MKKIIGLIVVCMMITACSHTDKSKNEVVNLDAQFDTFKTGFIEDLWKAFPSWASAEGMHDYDHILTIPNDSYRNEVIQFLDSSKARLSRFNLKSLSGGNTTDYYLIRDFIDGQYFQLNELKSYEWNPSQYNLGGQFFTVLNYRDHSLEKRLQNISEKLKAVGDFYTTARNEITAPTLVHTNLAIQQLKGSINVFDKAIRDSLDVSSLNDSEKNEITLLVDSAVASINGFVGWLENELKPQVERGERSIDFRLGTDLYEKKFKHNMSSTFTAREIYQKAIERKNDLHEKMFALTNKMWSKYLPESKMPEWKEDAIRMMIDTLSGIHAHRDSFIVTIRKQIPELEQFVIENDLMTLDPEKPLVVRATPEYMRGVAGASISAPGPYDSEAETYYNVTPLDHYSPEQAESYLREYNQYMLQILNIHEAIPGHYTQLIYSNQSPSLIKSILGNGAMIEGWAVYSELMMLENGYGNHSDELWLMYYKWNLRTVCNTILDYSVHVLSMNEEEALQLLMKEAFQQEEEARGKWRRVQLSSVQLCSYFTGFYEIMELRKELQKRKGESFDLKAFHEEFLSYGSAPVKYIRQLMLK